MSTWLLSSGNKKFQLDEYLKIHGYVDWSQKNKVKVGDVVFVYISKPIGVVKYKMKVDRVNMKFGETTDNEEFWLDKAVYEKDKKRDRYFRLVLEQVLPDDEKLTFKGLSYNGLGCVQRMQKLEGVKKDYFKDYFK